MGLSLGGGLKREEDEIGIEGGGGGEKRGRMERLGVGDWATPPSPTPPSNLEDQDINPKDMKVERGSIW